METPRKPQSGKEDPSLLMSYRWQTVLQNGEKDPAMDHGTAGSRRRGRLQKWKRTQSQPETELPQPSTEKPSSAFPQENRAVTKRSVFQRAFSAPTKMPKNHEGSNKLSLRKYLRSMSHRKNQEGTPRSERETREATKGDESSVQLAPGVTPDAHLWDVATVSLLDRQLVVLGREEEGLLQNRNRTNSSISESSSLYPSGNQRDSGE
ncbi:hypothetical protein JD844_009983 [Phrynosoma platyrhinos]|uniref:Uncharacterized protein n=1 Tax=Phrynosoma platyrhinos TaxID=52577 RepID=A0ABQ7TGJ7_PHRPL|nr:hypothetical protein JD844_009983 [Phrynosoma platyrhinos]